MPASRLKKRSLTVAAQFGVVRLCTAMYGCAEALIKIERGGCEEYHSEWKQATLSSSISL
jgi:hypothetical protein